MLSLAKKVNENGWFLKLKTISIYLDDGDCKSDLAEDTANA